MEENPHEKAARKLAASVPPPSPEARRELFATLRAINAKKAAQEPEAVAKRASHGDLRAEMRLTCERYLGREISLTVLHRRLLSLEQEEARSR